MFCSKIRRAYVMVLTLQISATAVTSVVRGNLLDGCRFASLLVWCGWAKVEDKSRVCLVQARRRGGERQLWTRLWELQVVPNVRVFW
jgi:hypothetical protein